MKKRILLIIIFVLLLGAIFAYVWFNVNIYFNRKYLLLKDYNRYSQLYDARACKEAYEFLTSGAKATNPYEKFKAACNNTGQFSEKKEIKDIVFINSGFARINVKRDITAGGEKASIDQAISWMLENGHWKRDWPN
jgi:hypothetical protein